MKKLFNNPWFVGAISLAALVHFATSVLALGLSEPAQAAYEEQALDFALPDEGLDPTFLDQDDAGKEMETALIDWLASRPRDPFAPPRSDAYGEHDNTEADSPPRLNALFYGANTARAVVDEQLVREGDLIAGYTVRQIDAHGVTLGGGPDGRLRLDAATAHVSGSP